MRARARGMLGRMFGSPSSKDLSGQLNGMSSQYSLAGPATSNPPSRLGVLPADAGSGPLQSAVSKRVSQADLSSDKRSITPTQQAPSGTAINLGEEATDPSIRDGMDKPLPKSPERRGSTDQATLKTRSRHVRQGATDDQETLQSPTETVPGRPLLSASDTMTRSDSSPPGKQFRQWTRDIHSMIDGEGIEDNIALELGLSHDSVSTPLKKRRHPVPQFSATIRPASGEEDRGQPMLMPRTSSLRTESTAVTPFDGRSVSSPPVSPAIAAMARVAGVASRPESQASFRTAAEEQPAHTGDVVDAVKAPDQSAGAASGVQPRVTESHGLSPVKLDTAGSTARLVQPAATLPDSNSYWSLASPTEVRTEASPPASLSRSAAWGAMASPEKRSSASKAVPAAIVNGAPPEDVDVEEQGRTMACEFLEEDETHVAQDRVAEYLGGV